MTMAASKERATAIARRASTHPGMITAGEISALAMAFLEAAGVVEKNGVAGVETAPAKAAKTKAKKGKIK